jgi:hypothetical protein
MQDWQNRTRSTGQAKQDRQNKTGRTGKTEQDQQNKERQRRRGTTRLP